MMKKNSKIPGLVLLIAVIGACSYLYVTHFPVLMPSRPNSDSGYFWKKQVFPNPPFEFLYETTKDADPSLAYSLSGNEIISTLSYKDGTESTSTAFTLYHRNPNEAPDKALTRLFITPLSDPYKRKHCVAAALPRLALMTKEATSTALRDPHKSAWVIIPDATYEAKIEKESGYDIPEPPCGENGEDYDAMSYYEFHSNNPTLFVRTGYYQDGPFFDQQSLTF